MRSVVRCIAVYCEEFNSDLIYLYQSKMYVVDTAYIESLGVNEIKYVMMAYMDEECTLLLLRIAVNMSCM
jgi:hypothetical protein